MLNILQPITIPAAAGGIIPFKLVDTVPVTRLWLEICKDPTSTRIPIDAVLVSQANNQWTVTIPTSFSIGRYGQNWKGILCIQTATVTKDELATLPLTFGIDTQYAPTEFTLNKLVTGEVTIVVNRVRGLQTGDTRFFGGVLQFFDGTNWLPVPMPAAPDMFPYDFDFTLSSDPADVFNYDFDFTLSLN